MRKTALVALAVASLAALAAPATAANLVANPTFAGSIAPWAPFGTGSVVYAAGTTDQHVTINVTDTTNGTTKSYSNALGHAFSPILDSSAFATCP